MDKHEIINRLEFILSEPDDMMREYLESLVQDIQYLKNQLTNSKT